ncbi:bacteriohopanetetrol glucosamine biosynthesis glycosyltransferase HpnI [Paraburkholderia sp.]|uniref:bacteriohopanetetrol glucosamine biosynthesis glycosyltransferase HpnI n=1 Tax=Paraburkholderia sp. TaxID=1926495 RepID=UPI002F41BBE3
MSALLVIGWIGYEQGPQRSLHLFAVTLAGISGTGAVLGMLYTLLAGALVTRFFARAPAEPASFPPVTVVKPLHGAERTLFCNLSSFCEQTYPGPVQFLFGVHDPADPALHTVEALRHRYPEAHITVVADTRLYGPNRKMSNIINMLPEAQHDVLVFADSDVSVGPNYLRHLVGELEKPGVGLVTCAYRGQPDPGFWPRLSEATTNYQFLPGVVTGLTFGLARPCFGPTIAMRRATLDRIGGFGRFVHHLAEDHAIGEAVRKIGEEVVVPPFTIAHACVEVGLGELMAHELRWSRTIRTIDPVGHLGSALMHPLPFALLTVIFAGAATWSWALAFAALLARLTLKMQSDRALRQAHRDLLLLAFWDIVSFAVFVASFFSTRVIWRGFSFEVDGNGLLSPVQDE